MKTALVTGGAGFIGSFFVRQKLREGEHVVVLDRLSYSGHEENLKDLRGKERLTFVKGDLNDRQLLAALFKTHKPCQVVNFAAESHVDRSISDPSPFLHSNVNGTVSLLEASLAFFRSLDPLGKRDFRFLQISTDEVYGSMEPGQMADENSPLQPSSPYAASKAAADGFVQAYFKTYGLPVLISRCTNNFGPRQFPEKLIPVVIDHARTHRPIPVYGDGSQIRDWIHVSDHCRAIARILETGTVGEIYNISGGHAVTNLELVEMICTVLSEEIGEFPPDRYLALIRHIGDRPGHDKRYAVDDRKLQACSRWAPAGDFPSMIRQTIRWYLENDDWRRAILDGNQAQAFWWTGNEKLGKAAN